METFRTIWMEDFANIWNGILNWVFSIFLQDIIKDNLYNEIYELHNEKYELHNMIYWIKVKSKYIWEARYISFEHILQVQPWFQYS